MRPYRFTRGHNRGSTPTNRRTWSSKSIRRSLPSTNESAFNFSHAESFHQSDDTNETVNTMNFSYAFQSLTTIGNKNKHYQVHCAVTTIKPLELTIFYQYFYFHVLLTEIKKNVKLMMTADEHHILTWMEQFLEIQNVFLLQWK